jgi:autotransporter-associated beta strand protein
MKPSHLLRSFLLAASSSLLAVSSASAQSGTWNVDANGTWGTNTNWLSNTIADGSGNTANFTNNITDDRTVSLDGDRTLTNLVFSDSNTATAGSWILNNNGNSANNLILAGTTPTITVNALGTDKTATISAIIQGTVGMSKSGAGTLILTSDNTYTGNTTVSQGTLKITSGGSSYANAYNGSAVVTVQSGAVLELDEWNYSTSAGLGQLAKEAARIVINGGTIRMNGNTTYGRGVTVGTSGATFEAAAGANWTQGGAFDFTANSYGTNAPLTFTGAGNGRFEKIFSGGGTLTKSGAGTWTLTGANTYTGATAINGGTLSAVNIVVSSGNSNLGNATSSVTLGSAGAQGTLSYTGSSASYTRGFTIGGAGGGRLDVTNSGQTLTVGTGAVTGSGLFTVGGAGNTTITSSLTHTGGLTKEGAGTLTISGTGHTYTGATNVNAGTLVVNASISTSDVTVSGTGSTLKGSGTIGGSVSIGSQGILASGTSIESLATGALSFTTGSNFQYELDKDALPGVAGDLTAVTGGLSLAGVVTLSFLETGSGSWELGNPLGNHFGITPADKLTLISYTGAWNGGLFTYLGNEVLDDSPIVIGGQQWWFNYNDIDAGTNFTGDLGSATSFVTITVPEPGAALIGSLGLLALLRRRRA